MAKDNIETVTKKCFGEEKAFIFTLFYWVHAIFDSNMTTALMHVSLNTTSGNLLEL